MGIVGLMGLGVPRPLSPHVNDPANRVALKMLDGRSARALLEGLRLRSGTQYLVPSTWYQYSTYST